jgi:hypothetical protein
VGTQHVVDEDDLRSLFKGDVLPLPAGWKKTSTGEAMPNVVHAVRPVACGALIMLVIDASAAVQAALPSDGFTFLDREELVAPALLWSEVPSVLHEMAWRGTVSR